MTVSKKAKGTTPVIRRGKMQTTVLLNSELVADIDKIAQLLPSSMKKLNGEVNSSQVIREAIRIARKHLEDSAT